MGHALLGDKLYGHTDAQFLALTRGTCPPEFPPFGFVPRQLLHAGAIAFTHPDTGAALRLCSPFRAAFGDVEYVAKYLLPGSDGQQIL